MPNCTLVIPTYNRPLYLRNLLNYYQQQNFDLPIIIADSSSDQDKKINKQIITLFNKLKIKYLGHYSPNLNPHHKFADMIQYVKTHYCSFCPDDDLVTPNGIKAGVEFLEKHPSYVAAHGRYISFYIQDNNPHKKQFWWKPMYQSCASISDNEPKDRLSSHLSNYNQTLWTVRRAGIVKNVYQELLKSKTDPWLFGELLPDILIAISGKIKYLDVLFMARRAESHISFWPSWRKFLAHKKYYKKFDPFKQCIANYLQNNSDLNSKQALQATNQALNIYINHFYPNTAKHFFINRIKYMLDYLPLKQYAQLTKLYIKIKNHLKQNWYNTNSPLPVQYHSDFNQIRSITLNQSNTIREPILR